MKLRFSDYFEVRGETPLYEVCRALVDIAKLLPADQRVALHKIHAYGNLSGQKALNTSHLSGLATHSLEFGIGDALAAIRTSYVLVARFIAIWSLRDDLWLKSVSKYGDPDLVMTVRTLLTGALHREQGINEEDVTEEYGWFIDQGLKSLLPAIRHMMESALESEVLANLKQMPDPFQWIYPRLVPRTLLHATGEFYTPYWLAQLLLKDTGWNPDQSLVDPFCGSGVFLLAALKQGIFDGARPTDVLNRLHGIDSNSAACVAARAGIILHYGRKLVSTGTLTTIPIFRNDTLIGGPQNSSLFTDNSKQETKLFDVVVTNPPWVGWEYIPRAYRDQLTNAWRHYSLFTAKGRDAAFLKEDLSTLALFVAWDHFLREGGKTGVVLRPASMKSPLASRELRRLELFPASHPLNLYLIRQFKLKTFGTTSVEAAAWILEKGNSTQFPVRVAEWRTSSNAKVGSQDSLENVLPHVNENELIASRMVPADKGSIWIIASKTQQGRIERLRGRSYYRARVGVFTGGANGVYYVEPLGDGRFRNIIDRAKRVIPEREFSLEKDMVYRIVRGRDISSWRIHGGSNIICPHTRETRMNPIPDAELKRAYPLTYDYFLSQKDFLEQRQGFTTWDRSVMDTGFYSLQRVGAYTFEPYKVCWKYISARFECVVIPPDENHKPCLVNDKVMFVGLAERAEAYYLCGLLSSRWFSEAIQSSTMGTQISASCISDLHIPKFDPLATAHCKISKLCEIGHTMTPNERMYNEIVDELDATVGKLYEVSDQPAIELIAHSHT